MKIVRYIKKGLLSIADSVVESRPYTYPAAGGFERDKQQLTGDVRRVGNDMRKAINKHAGKQPHKPTRP